MTACGGQLPTNDSGNPDHRQERQCDESTSQVSEFNCDRPAPHCLLLVIARSGYCVFLCVPLRGPRLVLCGFMPTLGITAESAEDFAEERRARECDQDLSLIS